MQKYDILFRLTPLAILYARCHAAATCQNSRTIQLTLGNCTLLYGNDETQDVNSWGIRMAVAGSQEICIVPSTVVNSTFITAQGICATDQLVDANGIAMTDRQCRSRRGGFIDPSKVPAESKEGLEDINPGWKDLGNTIEAAVDASLQLDRKPVTMIEGLITKGQMSTQSHLGLATGSTLLQTLKDAEMIGARSWGLNSGSQSVASPRGGSLVLGGYDEASLASPFFDFPIQNTLRGKRYCPLQVTITGLVASIQNASKSEEAVIIDEGQTMDVCIEPYDNLFRMPTGTLELFTRFFREFTNHQDDPIEPQAYKASLLNLEPGLVYPDSIGDLNATLRITINNSLTVEIPHYEFQRPLRGLDKAGNVVLDTSYKELLIYRTPAEDYSPVIGKALLSQLYLFVDYDAMMFHLALQNVGTDTPLPVSSVDCDESQDEGGFSPTTKGLIGVGSVLGILLLTAVLFGFYFYRRFWLPSHQQHGPPELYSPAPPPTEEPAPPLAPPPPEEGTQEGKPLVPIQNPNQTATTDTVPSITNQPASNTGTYA